jgi:uncharacterized iron-regulated protein
MIFLTSILISFIINFQIFAQETQSKVNYPIIYSFHKWEKIKPSELALLFEGYDVIILGEEHDDNFGHEEKLKLIKLFSEKYPITISMEMFERDQQAILDEYISGQIDEKLFKIDMRLWNNYEKDYRPIVEFAKEKKLKIIASNAPRRYVRMVSRNGIEKLKELTQEAYRFLPPLHLITTFRNTEYESKVSLMLGDTSSQSLHSQTLMKNFVLAQHLWDASMSHAISEHLTTKTGKIVHINGRMHSDDGMGVTNRLRQAGFKVLTVSMFPIKIAEKRPEDFYAKTADIIYITGDKTKDLSE